MVAIRVDESRLPLLTIEFVGACTDAELEDYLRTVSRVLQRQLPYALVVDASRAAGFGASQRQRQAAWTKEHDGALRAYCTGIAVIITSPIVRGAMTAVLWISPLPVPYIITGTKPEAQTWVEERLGSRGVTAGR